MDESLMNAYNDRTLFTPQILSFSPPAEIRNSTICFELTTGCNYNRCTFCDGYNGVPFTVKPLEEYKRHVDEVLVRCVDRSKRRKFLRGSYQRRCYIGSGTSLAVPTEELADAIKYTSEAFRRQFMEYDRGDYHYPDRISLYGSINDIIKKGPDELSHLRPKEESGYNKILIYVGLESGSTGLLKWINKGYSIDEIMKAAEVMDKTGREDHWQHENSIDISVMVIAGLGGMLFYDSHIVETARALNALKPRFVTFLGIVPHGSYKEKMDEQTRSGLNRPLTQAEAVQQIAEILDKTRTRRRQNFKALGGYDVASDTPLWFNYSTMRYLLSGPFIDCQEEKDGCVKALRAAAKMMSMVGRVKVRRFKSFYFPDPVLF